MNVVFDGVFMSLGTSVNVNELINEGIDKFVEGADSNFKNLAFKFQVQECEIHNVMSVRLANGSLSQAQYSELLQDLRKQDVSSVLEK